MIKGAALKSFRDHRENYRSHRWQSTGRGPI